MGTLRQPHGVPTAPQPLQNILGHMGMEWKQEKESERNWSKKRNIL